MLKTSGRNKATRSNASMAQDFRQAYAAAPPRDVVGLQRELLTHGPVEVAFFVAQLDIAQAYRKAHTLFRRALRRYCMPQATHTSKQRTRHSGLHTRTVGITKVFSDFMSYKRGVYFRTPGAFGPLGGAETSNVPGRNQGTSETAH